MIGSPFFKKLKVNSLWWLLIAVVVVLLGAVVIGQTSLDLNGQRRLLAEEPAITVEIGKGELEKIVYEGTEYSFYFVEVKFFDKDGKLIKTSELAITADKYFGGKGKEAVESLIFEATPGFTLRGTWKTSLPPSAGGSIPIQEPSPAPFTPTPNEILKIDLNIIPIGHLARDENPHEASHGINSVARQMFPDRDGTGLHIGFDKNNNPEVVWMYEPKTTIRDMRSSVPRFAQARNRYRKYFIEQNRDWNNLTYIFDEWSAYVAGARDAVEKAEAGKWREGGRDVIDGAAEFIVFGTTVATYLKENEPRYFARKDFQAILKYQLEQSADLIKRGLQFDAFNQFRAQDTIDRFLNDPGAAALRRMLIELYGLKWFDNVFNFR